ncbi:MAG: hypothetical protein P8Q90_01400, partial [Candidatus Thalassarchaeaceae archaeon]|nr:hypothetical protein [Candidatus Thalassarchaeaceae archaeon]
MDALLFELDMLQHLETIRQLSSGSSVQTKGLSDEVVQRFCAIDPDLVQAITEAASTFEQLIDEVGVDFLAQDEGELATSLQSEFINFYSAATINPYVAIAACGPWVITSKGAVVHDNGGYGMLGSGHGPGEIIDSMSKNWVMANVMTPSFSQKRLTD